MLKELRESYVTKFDSPMTAYLYYTGNEGNWDDDAGSSTEWDAWYGRIGRRIVVEQSSGAVSSWREATEEDAQKVIDEVNAEYSQVVDEEAW